MDSIIETANHMAEVTAGALLELADNPQQLETWIKQCGRNITILNAALKKGDLNVGVKKNVESNIGLIKGYRVMMKALSRRGAGYTRPKEVRSDRICWEDVKSAFKGRIRTGVIINLRHVDPLTFLEDAFKVFAIRVKKAVKEHNLLKVNTNFCGEFSKEAAGEVMCELKNFSTKNNQIDQETDLKQWWEEHVQDNLIVQLEDFQERDSGWALTAIINIAVNINKYEPFSGSSYIPLPEEIARKQAVINVKNEDEACFAWAVVSALYPQSNNSQLVSSYPNYSTVLNTSGITFPMTMGNIQKFERQNDISINVYILEERRWNLKVQPTRLTKNKKPRHVNLLMIQDTYDENVEEVKYHFCWIKSLSRLLSKQLSKHHGKIYICERCLHYFHNEDKLNKHAVDCQEINDCRVVTPWQPEDKIVKFKKHENQQRVPFVVYADFESLLKPVKKRIGKKTEIYQEHTAFSVGYYFKCYFDDSLSYYKSYRGEDCKKWFVNELKQVVEDIEPVYWVPIPMTITPEETESFEAATECHICKKPFVEGELKIRDHDHKTSLYRGAAHNLCNLNYQESKVIPVVFHNLSGYDAHFIIKDIALEFEGGISLLPINKEKFISFTKRINGSGLKLRFIDSLRFMPYSLDKLASFLDELPIVRKEYPELSEEKLKLLTRKGVFPYDYVTSWEKLDEPKLPSKKHFENKLALASLNGLDYEKQQRILEKREAQLCKDYEHAQKIWNEFECNSIGEYSDLYLKTDVLLLADVFENFRETCYNAYGLDACNYVSAPGLTWDAMLKYTEVELELITDMDMLLFVERGIRGGISQCSNRYSKANNKYMTDYDPEQPSKYLMYYDVNNLYGWAMSQFLPYGGFKWCKTDMTQNITKIPDDYHTGCILEVDLEYPDNLHDQHKDLPFCAQHHTPPGSKQKKLMTTLYSKERYVIHYRALKQALKQGVKLKKIHRVLEFKQSAWMKQYIDLNTKLRTQAKNEFEKTFFKLMNNACFGKTMEDVRKRKIVKLVSKWDGRYSAKVMIAKPNFHSRTIINEDLVLIELNKTEVIMNKPIYVGMSVLDISKTKLYEFHYGYMQPKFGSKCKVLYTDTDSLIYEVQCDDIYSEIKKDIKQFDTSDYAPDNPYQIPRVNRKIPGLMKDENNGEVMTEFVGLRSKMYSGRVQGEDAVKKAKGVKGYVVKQALCFDDYVNCLFGRREVTSNQNCIRSIDHNLYSVKQTKVALSPADNKRYLLPNCTDTLPWGHCSIMHQ